MVARHVRDVEAGSSNLPSPTIYGYIEPRLPPPAPVLSAELTDVAWSAEMKKLAVVASALAVLVLAGCGAGAEESGESDSESATAECPQPDAADATAITKERADMLIGFTESDAELCATGLEWEFRVGERDGEGFALTADYRQQRVTVSVTNDLVTAVVVG